MTLHRDQIQAALDHALDAADLDATAPSGLGASAPVVPIHVGRAAGSRRRLLAVAAAVLVVAGLAVGAFVVGSRPDAAEPADGGLPTATGPVVAAALDAPGLVLLDWADPPVTPADAPERSVPTAHLRVLRSADGQTIAVADRAADGDGSLDRFALEGSRTVDGVEVASTYGADVGSLDVSGWVAGDRRIRVATRGLSSSEHDAAVEPFVSASRAGTLPGLVPPGFTEQYDGPDENPFSRVGLGAEADYEARPGTGGADRVTVLRLDAVVGADELDRYAWYWTDARPTTVEGVPALIAADPTGGASLYLARPDGMVVISAGADDVVGYARSVVVLDAAGWRSHRATAQAPGSIHTTAEATTATTSP